MTTAPVEQANLPPFTNLRASLCALRAARAGVRDVRPGLRTGAWRPLPSPLHGLRARVDRGVQRADGSRDLTRAGVPAGLVASGRALERCLRDDPPHCPQMAAR
jgi:hypothetical protein